MRVALAAGLTLLTVGVGLALLRSPTTVAAANHPANAELETVGSTRHSTSYCQGGESLPRDTTAIRMSLASSIGPRVKVTASSGGHAITGGEQESGWTGYVVVVPLKPLARTVPDVTICASFHPTHETVGAFGERTPAGVAAREDGRPILGRIGIEDLRPGTRSWLSLAGEVVRNMGLGRALGGEWVACFVLALLVAVATLASGLVYAELR